MLGLRRLVELWTDLELARVLGFGMRQVLTLPRVLLGGGDGYGLFDVRPMADLVQREISWRAVSRCLRRGMLRALTVSCTEVSTGRTVVFMQVAPELTIPGAAPPRTLFRADRIGPHHALASAAIPLLFPPVRIDGELHLDGGLRQNTPIAPALRLGATHIFAIGSSREVQGRVVREAGHQQTRNAPGAAFLLGKVLNAFLLDHVDVDIELLTRINNVLVDGDHAYGPGFADSLSGEARKRGAQEYRYVKCAARAPERGHRPARERPPQARRSPGRPGPYASPFQPAGSRGRGRGRPGELPALRRPVLPAAHRARTRGRAGAAGRADRVLPRGAEP